MLVQAELVATGGHTAPAGGQQIKRGKRGTSNDACLLFVRTLRHKHQSQTALQ